MNQIIKDPAGALDFFTPEFIEDAIKRTTALRVHGRENIDWIPDWWPETTSPDYSTVRHNSRFYVWTSKQPVCKSYYGGLVIPSDPIICLSERNPDFDDWASGDQAKDPDSADIVPSKNYCWMSLAPLEKESQTAAIAFSYGHVLVGGLGMGWVAYNMALRPGVESVTVIEYDQDVIDVFMEATENLKGWSPKITIVKGDLFDADTLAKTGRESFDYAYYDHWPFIWDENIRPDMRRLVKLYPADVNSWWGMEGMMVDILGAVRENATAQNAGFGIMKDTGAVVGKYAVENNITPAGLCELMDATIGAKTIATVMPAVDFILLTIHALQGAAAGAQVWGVDDDPGAMGKPPLEQEKPDE